MNWSACLQCTATLRREVRRLDCLSADHTEEELFVFQSRFVPRPILEHDALLKRTEPGSVVVKGVQAPVEGVIERTFVGAFKAETVRHVAVRFPNRRHDERFQL